MQQKNIQRSIGNGALQKRRVCDTLGYVVCSTQLKYNSRVHYSHFALSRFLTPLSLVSIQASISGQHLMLSSTNGPVYFSLTGLIITSTRTRAVQKSLDSGRQIFSWLGDFFSARGIIYTSWLSSAVTHSQSALETAHHFETFSGDSRANIVPGYLVAYYNRRLASNLQNSRYRPPALSRTLDSVHQPLRNENPLSIFSPCCSNVRIDNYGPG